MVTSDRLFGPYDPVKDFQTRQQFIVLGNVAIHEGLQEAIIESNLEKESFTIFSLGNIQWEPRPFSKWEICKIAMKDRFFIARAVVAVAMCALGVYFWRQTAFTVMKYYKWYTDQVPVNIWYRGIVHTRTLDLFDVINWGSELAGVNLLYNALCLLPMWSAARVVQTRLLSEPKHRVAIRELLQIDTPFSLNAPGQPPTLAIGKSKGGLWDVVHRVLSKHGFNSCPHPFENRAMTFEEQKTFIQALAKLFDIPVQNFDPLWSEEPQKRKERFLSFLPQSVVKKHGLAALFNEPIS